MYDEEKNADRKQHQRQLQETVTKLEEQNRRELENKNVEIEDIKSDRKGLYDEILRLNNQKAIDQDKLQRVLEQLQRLNEEKELIRRDIDAKKEEYREIIRKLKEKVQ